MARTAIDILSLDMIRSIELPALSDGAEVSPGAACNELTYPQIVRSSVTSTRLERKEH